MADIFIPLHALKGRGAATRLAHRFARDERAAFDDGWGSQDELQAEAPDLASLVAEEQLKLPEAWAAWERRRADAEAAEQNKQQTLLRLTEAAYRGMSALSHDGFCQEVTDRLKNEKFRQQLLDRLHLDTDEFTDIGRAAANLKRLVGRLT